MLGQKKNQIRKSKLLLVEGNHEKDFFDAWLKFLKRDDIQVMTFEGKTSFKRFIRLIVKQSEFQSVVSILIIRDADNDSKSAFDSIRGNLKNIGLPFPENTWTFTQDTTPKVGIAILPSEGKNGALEELLLQIVVGDPILEKSYKFVDDAIITLNETGYRNPPSFHRLGKARIHAFLATFEYPDRDQGKSALAGIWDFQHGSLDPLRAILEEL
jgi:hypothetical protein